MKSLRAFAVAITSVALASSAVTAFARPQHNVESSITAAARSATAQYHSLNLAKKSGYSILADTAGVTCIAEPGMGAMGVHYVRGDLVKDPAIDARHPEALVYAPDSHGRLQLAALEYVVIKNDWDAKQVIPQSAAPAGVKDIPAPPMLFGQKFNFTDAPNRYGLPPFYSLHAWLWKDNPAGTFAMWNPDVHCQS